MDSLYEKAANGLTESLYKPYQEDGCKWMLNRECECKKIFETDMPNGGILADEVGLGKTIMTLSVILGNVLSKTLIILPKSLISQWISQINKFSKYKLNVVLIDKKTIVNKDGIYIMSQSLFNCRGSVVGKSPVHGVTWDRIIIDEAHSLRNNKSKYYESCCLLDSKIKWALTATPVMNRMTDFVNIMNWIGVEQFYCQTEKDIITNMFILRRTKEYVKEFNKSLELPKCNFNIKHIQFETDEETDLYLKTFTKSQDEIKNSNNYMYMLERLLRIRQICIHPQLYLDGVSKKTNGDKVKWNSKATKIDALMKEYKTHVPNDKILIFCQFVQEMTIIANELKEINQQSVRIDGTMSIEERANAVEIFKKESTINTFIIQINTGGQGINLQNANKIYIMAPNWNPALEYQAIGRSHRTGQKREVTVTKFVISSGDSRVPFVEENIINLQENKQKIVCNILNEENLTTAIKKYDMLNKRDIYTLFNLYNQ